MNLSTSLASSIFPRTFFKQAVRSKKRRKIKKKAARDDWWKVNGGGEGWNERAFQSFEGSTAKIYRRSTNGVVTRWGRKNLRHPKTEIPGPILTFLWQLADYISGLCVHPRIQMKSFALSTFFTSALIKKTVWLLINLLVNDRNDRGRWKYSKIFSQGWSLCNALEKENTQPFP